MTEFEQNLFSSMIKLVPELLKVHSYGVYELAQEFSSRLEEPLYEVMTPLTITLETLTNNGEVVYDRMNNQIMLAH
ncbi:MAG: hypothetical protein F6K30_22645 [Cyanothece sp. SIO2G6]|nr:hypothetical protein [Cyanothece sp. SIO2G6]